MHFVRWLPHSARKHIEYGLLLKNSYQLGLRQLVRKPTREKYMLDTDVPDYKATPCATVADHNGMLTQFKF